MAEKTLEEIGEQLVNVKGLKAAQETLEFNLINSIQIGGKNFIPDSAAEMLDDSDGNNTVLTWWSVNHINLTFRNIADDHSSGRLTGINPWAGDNDKRYLYLTTANDSVRARHINSSPFGDKIIKAGAYTLSFWYYLTDEEVNKLDIAPTNSEVNPIYIAFFILAEARNYLNSRLHLWKDVPANAVNLLDARNIKAESGWHYVYHTFNIAEDEIPTSEVKFYIEFLGGTLRSIGITNIQLEYGSRATDWSPADADYTYKFKKITETADSISSTMGEVSANVTSVSNNLNSSVNALRRGVLNLVKNSAAINNTKDSWYGDIAPGTDSEYKHNGNNYFILDNSSGSSSKYVGNLSPLNTGSPKKGDIYTLSLLYYITNYSSDEYVADFIVQIKKDNENSIQCGTKTITPSNVTQNKWTKIVVTTGALTITPTTQFLVIILARAGTKILFTEVQLESGEFAHDWAPWEDDIKGLLDGVATTVTTLGNALNNLGQEILSAKEALNAKNLVYSSADDPQSNNNNILNIGDLWFNSNNHKLYRWNGTGWIDFDDYDFGFDGYVQNKYSTITQTTEQIKSVVGSIKMGTANYIKNSATNLGNLDYWSRAPYVDNTTNEKYYPTIERHVGQYSPILKNDAYIIFTNSTNYLPSIVNSTPFELCNPQVGDIYTLSLYYYISDNDLTNIRARPGEHDKTIFTGYVDYRYDDNGTSTYTSPVAFTVSEDDVTKDKWTRVSGTVTLLHQPTESFRVTITGWPNTKFFFTDVLLERGSVLTDWIPWETSVEAKLSEISLTADKISMQVTNASLVGESKNLLPNHYSADLFSYIHSATNDVPDNGKVTYTTDIPNRYYTLAGYIATIEAPTSFVANPPGPNSGISIHLPNNVPENGKTYTLSFYAWTEDCSITPKMRLNFNGKYNSTQYIDWYFEASSYHLGPYDGSGSFVNKTPVPNSYITITPEKLYYSITFEYNGDTIISNSLFRAIVRTYREFEGKYLANFIDGKICISDVALVEGEIPMTWNTYGTEIHNSSVDLTADEFSISFDDNPVFIANAKEVAVKADQFIATGHILGDIVNTLKGITLTSSGGSESYTNLLIASLNKYLTDTVVIEISGYHEELIWLDGFLGPGPLRLRFEEGAQLIGGITVKNCQCPVYIEAFNDNRQRIIFANHFNTSVINVDNCAYVEIDGISLCSNLIISNSPKCTTGISASYNSTVSIINCLFENFTYCVSSIYLSHVLIEKCIGGGNEVDGLTLDNTNLWFIKNAYGMINGTAPVYTNLSETRGYAQLLGAPSESVASDNTITTPGAKTIFTWKKGKVFLRVSDSYEDMVETNATNANTIERTLNVRLGIDYDRTKFYSNYWTLDTSTQDISDTLNGKTIEKILITFPIDLKAIGNKYSLNARLGVHQYINNSFHEGSLALAFAPDVVVLPDSKFITFELPSAWFDIFKSEYINCFWLCCENDYGIFKFFDASTNSAIPFEVIVTCSSST